MECNVVLSVFGGDERTKMPQRHLQLRRRAQISGADAGNSTVVLVHGDEQQLFGALSGLFRRQYILRQPKLDCLLDQRLTTILAHVMHLEAFERLSIHVLTFVDRVSGAACPPALIGYRRRLSLAIRKRKCRIHPARARRRKKTRFRRGPRPIKNVAKIWPGESEKILIKR